MPNGHRWQVESGDASLYNDARLTTRLYTFPAQDRLPRVIADTGAAAVPRYGDVPLNEETMMLALLKSGTVSPDSINWVNAAQDRYNDEQSLRDRTDWKHVDPWGLWFTANPSGKPDLVARFKDWTLRRAASLPDQVVLRQVNYFASAPNGLRVLGQERTYATSDNKAAVDSLQKKGGGLANLLSYDYRIHASTGPIMAVSPLANSAYVVPRPSRTRAGRLCSKRCSSAALSTPSAGSRCST